MSDTPQGAPSWPGDPNRRVGGVSSPPVHGRPDGGPSGYPYQTPPGPPQYPAAGGVNPGNPMAGGQGGSRLNRFAGWSFGLGLGALLIAPLGIVAIVFGIIGLVQIPKRPNQRGRWQAITGIVTGLILGIVSAGIGVAVLAGSQDLNTSQVQSQVKTLVQNSTQETVSVSCPSNIPAKTGHVFYCTVTTPYGSSQPIKVTYLGNHVIQIGNPSAG
jgi:hypothetical protein